MNKLSINPDDFRANEVWWSMSTIIGCLLFTISIYPIGLNEKQLIKPMFGTFRFIMFMIA